MPLIGAHLPTGKGLAKTAYEAARLGLQCFQIFVRNPRGSAMRKLSAQEIEDFKSIIREAGIDPVVAHVPYISNPASVKPDLYELAERIIKEDLERCDMLGIRYLVLHPGSATGSSLLPSMERLAKLLNRVLLGYQGTTQLVIETMAGQGSEIGSRFEELKWIWDAASVTQETAICLDTCHVYAAGYDIKEDLEGVIDSLESVFGVNAVKLVHVNDSTYGLGARRDRHAPIGEGVLGEKTMARLMTHPYFNELPFILETPLETLENDISTLRRLMIEG